MPGPDRKEKPANLLEFTPVHLARWEQDAQGIIVLLIPKFTNAFLAKHVMPRMKRPNFRIKLDEFGTWVWLHIDGRRTVYQIGVELQQEFGDKVEPVFQRLGLFINSLAQHRYISLHHDKVKA